ncbi:hypothetical protein CSC23_4931 (plasmid) [Escherichia coli]|uniref:Uncharacterized protein n=1 Tax=Escherichia coli TaxID=562 RepID=A0A411JII8_ECOLX|nr:hypothetical protein SeKA_C0031 [Salmonella enterica subsp. enterica serovar Kentucky str. CVM29188]AVN12607.1 hypothetical protein CSC11_4817 [Escherichia coli]AWF14006.1 hypothetical protein CSC23_4931 [Escherichia coli]QBC36055.1 hypothetical protein [Escherichia coli]QRG43664.1 hypothetical protein [Escherichia coli]
MKADQRAAAKDPRIRNLGFSDLRKGSEQKTDSEAYEL